MAGRRSQSRGQLGREAGERRKSCIQALRLSSPLRRQLSFPYRKCRTTHFRLLFRDRPHHTQEPGSHLPGSGSGRGKRCGPLWKPLVIPELRALPEMFLFYGGEGRERQGRRCKRQTRIGGLLTHPTRMNPQPGYVPRRERSPPPFGVKGRSDRLSHTGRAEWEL